MESEKIFLLYLFSKNYGCLSTGYDAIEIVFSIIFSLFSSLSTQRSIGILYKFASSSAQIKPSPIFIAHFSCDYASTCTLFAVWLLYKSSLLLFQLFR